MISDITEFCKLFKIHVPVAQEQEYYFSQLQKSPQYDWLADMVLEFERWERELLQIDSKVEKEKYKYLNQVVDRLRAAQAYTAINSSSLPPKTQDQFDRRQDDINLIFALKTMNIHFVSIDVKSANYTLFSRYDSENKLCSNWKDYILDLPVPLQKSKSFRQVVFGNLNPKRTQKLIFSDLTLKVKEKIDAYFHHTEQCCTLLTDEIIYMFQSEQDAKQFCQNFPQEIEAELGLRLRLTYFLPQLISGKYFYRADVVEDIFSDQEKKYKKLIGVPGNQFYYYFKKFVLEKEIEERDLFFQQDGQLAKWVF